MGIAVENVYLIQEVLSNLNTGGLFDFQRAEEIIYEAGLDLTEVSKEIARRIKKNKNYSQKIDPVRITYEIIKKRAEEELKILKKVKIQGEFLTTSFYLPEYEKDKVLKKLEKTNSKLSKSTEFLLKEIL